MVDFISDATINTFVSFSWRRFRRRVTIPKGVNPESVTSTMSPQGILTILAPKMMLEGKIKLKQKHWNKN